MSKLYKHIVRLSFFYIILTQVSPIHAMWTSYYIRGKQEELLSKAFREKKDITSLNKLLAKRSAKAIISDIKNFDDIVKEALLIQASEEGNSKAIQILLDCNANINCTNDDGNTPLICACRTGKTNAITLLLTHKNGYIRNLRTIHQLCTKLVPKNAKLAINCFTNKQKELLLLEACKRNNSQAVRILLDCNTKIDCIDANGDTPLMYACKKNYTKNIEILILKGAQVNIPNKYGNTPLFHICKHKNLEALSLLISHKAEINIQNKLHNTPLIMACKNNNTEAMDLLILHGAHINTKNKKENTPLIIACKNNFEEAAQLLVSRGAYINIKNKHGDTPLTLTCYNKNFALVQFLVLHGATIEKENNKQIPAFCYFSSTTKTGQELIIMHANQHHLLEIVKNIDELKNKYIKKYLSKIVYNHQFLLHKKFEHAKNIALQNNFVDLFGRTVLQAILFYLTGCYECNRNRFLSHYFGKFKSSTLQDIANSIKYTKTLGECRKKQYRELRNMQLTWNDLRNAKHIPDEVIGHIMYFAGVTSFANKQIYGKTYSYKNE